MISCPGTQSPARRSSRRNGLPLLGTLAALLVSAQPVAAQQRMLTPAIAALPTWQSSPVLTKFLEELRAPGKITVALPDGTRTFSGSPLVADHYTIDINEFKDQLHPSLPPTTLWGYNPTLALGVGAGAIVPQSHLGGIIIAQRGKPTQVTFRNNLPDQHIQPVDTSIQGSDPSVTQNRTSTHLHGGKVPWTSDGGPFSFWDRTGNRGVTFKNNETLRPLEVAAGTIPLNEAEYYYPNDQSARLMWYHDHAMGITRLNAYAGIASAYIIRDKFEAALVRDFGLPKFVENGGRELPLIFQDKIFQNGNTPANPDRPFPGAARDLGNLWYPYDYEEKWGDPANPTTPAVSVVPEAFGDTMLVNGTAYPKATVDPRRYRFRVLNACNARVLNLQLYEDNGQGQPDFTKPGPNWMVIGTEGGFLARPVSLPSARLTTFVDAVGGRWVDPAAPGGSLHLRPLFQPRLRQTSKLASLCAFMRKNSVSMPLSTTQALKGASVMPAVRSTGPKTSLIKWFGPHKAPAITLPCPSRCLVAACITRSAPHSVGRCSAGEQKVLSTTSSAPPAWARSASARMSQTSVSGLVGVSAKNKRVLGLTASRHSPRSVCETNVVSTPNLPNSLANRLIVEPNTEREQMTWSPTLSRPMISSRMALMPVAVATQASVPSIAASRASKLRTVGLLARA